ncbi:MAG: response regulator [Myxococcota bacterium]|nr:response regulator [Myxococcota bacterium]
MPRVLVVDDFPDARDLLSGYLTSRGFETEEAVDGLDAVTRATERPPDVILMDIAMPRMDGIEATTLLKKDPRTAHVPVIAVTGQAHDPSSVVPPCDSVLVKPVDPERVEREIRKVLGAKSSRANILGAARAASRPARRAAAKAAPGASRSIVWLIEPSEAIRGAITQLLTRERFDVRAFASADEALDDPSELELDAVVVDLEIPDAVELALALRNRSELEEIVLVGLEPEDAGAPDEIRPLFDALVARSDDVLRLPDVLRRALQLRDGGEPSEISVEVGDPIFASDDGDAFGTVLEVRREFLMVDVAGAGAFVVPATAVASIAHGRIVVDAADLDDDLRAAIGAAAQ